ncbi:heavy-metal-associated domain-containing protein [Burkholderia ubonensis]|uniref:heavy-metal-associated domain-containing protein n=1 Tax=Burkholderia ubonensis TaxID=101571 RepID=UPI0018DF9ACD
MGCQLDCDCRRNRSRRPDRTQLTGVVHTDRIEFTVVGAGKIHCSGCEARIRFALERLSGVQTVSADAETQRVTVTFDPARLMPDQMQETLKEMGFDMEVLS